jgi:hypothetical protein
VGTSTRVIRTASADLRPWPLRLLLPLVARTLVPYVLRRGTYRAVKRHCESTAEPVERVGLMPQAPDAVRTSAE